MIYTVRNIARAGIPIFGYNWMPSHVWRTPPAHIRGGAVATAYDHSLGQQMPLTHDRVYSEEEIWANLEYWIKIITPIAEEEGIRLGIHPCDPPVPVLGGIPQILRNFAAYKRLVEIYPYPSTDVYAPYGPPPPTWGYSDVAFDMGFRIGLTEGQRDAAERKSFNPDRHDDYRDADKGYHHDYGKKDAYRSRFRAGYLQGYQDGFGRLR